MKSTRILMAVFGIASCALLVEHWINLPDISAPEWFCSPRFTKSMAYQITGEPYESGSWASLWGTNHISTSRPHAILSELQIKVQHESRANLVYVELTGDSEQEVNALFETVKRDFDRTYIEPHPVIRGLPERHGRLFTEVPEKTEQSYYYRQKYLWLLLVNIVIAGIICILDQTKSTKRSAGGNADLPRASA